MNIYIKTKVHSNFTSVYNRFDLKLFKALKPPGMPLEVKRFDGCSAGDEVHLEVGPFRQKWVSVITQNIQNDEEIYFIDEGKVTPFPISTWVHTHRMDYVSDSECYIIDDIEYKCTNVIFTLLMYPLLYIQFLLRRPVYKTIFNS